MIRLIIILILLTSQVWAAPSSEHPDIHLDIQCYIGLDPISKLVQTGLVTYSFDHQGVRHVSAQFDFNSEQSYSIEAIIEVAFGRGTLVETNQKTKKTRQAELTFKERFYEDKSEGHFVWADYYISHNGFPVILFSCQIPIQQLD